MKAQELLDAIGQVKSEYILGADQPVTIRRLNRRGLLVAAAIAATLLLAGCAAVVAMTLKDRNIGEMAVTHPYDLYGETVAETERTYAIAAMSGYSGSPAHQAAKAWNDFRQSYQPEITDNNPDKPEIPNQYEYTYDCYDQVMVDKVNEIAETYGLKLLGTWAVAQRWQQDAAYEKLGIGGILRPEAQVKANMGLIVFPPHNFNVEGLMTLTGEDAPWSKECGFDFSYLKKGYFDPRASFTYDPASSQEWEYTAADGTKLLLALWEKHGVILAQKEDADIAITLDMDFGNLFLDREDSLPTREALEAVADCFDYTIATKEMPMEGLQAELDKIENPSAGPRQYERSKSYAEEVQYISYPQFLSYAMADTNGDGIEELLIGYGDGIIVQSWTTVEGTVQDYYTEPFRLCQNGVADGVNFFTDVEEGHRFVRLGKANPMPQDGYEWKMLETETLEGVAQKSGQWFLYGRDRMGPWDEGEKITEAQAQAILDKYPPVELNWQPLLSFPVDEQGTTLGDVLEAEGTPNEAELLAFYAANYPQDYYGETIHYFALRDINGDGMDDLLLSGDGKRVTVAGTWLRGRWQDLYSDFYLCEGNVLKQQSTGGDYDVGKYEYFSFNQKQGGRSLGQTILWHSLSHGTWNIEWPGGQPLTEAEAQAILDKYPEIDPGFRPISELG